MSRPLLPLRLLLTLVAVGLFALVVMVSLGLALYHAERKVEREYRDYLAAEVARFVRIVEHNLADDPLEVQREVALHATEPDSRVTAVVDADGRVRFGQRSQWRGRPAAEALSHWDPERLERALADASAQVWRLPEGRLLAAMMPFDAVAGGDLGKALRGVVYLVYDLGPDTREAYGRVLARHGEELLFVLLAAVLLGLGMHRALARPLAAMAGVIRQTTEGRRDVRAAGGRVRETARLAADFNRLVTTLDDNERQLEAERRRYRMLFDEAPVGIVHLDTDGRITACNDRLVEIVGSSREALLGLDMLALPDHRMVAVVRRCLGGEPDRFEGLYHSATAPKATYMRALFTPLVDAAGDVSGAMGVVEDFTERKQYEDEIERMTWRDSLTGLPNRGLLRERISQTVAAAGRKGKIGVLLVFDLDRFAAINDARGHVVGDALLQALGQRLAALAREGGTVARLSADEFGVLAHALDADAEAAVRRAKGLVARLKELLQGPFEVVGERYALDASFGVTLVRQTDDPGAPERLLQEADNALHRAKARGLGEVAFFELGMDRDVKERFELESELRAALVHHELALYLQPQLDGDGVLVGYEGLLRWQHPHRGLLVPGTFIPVAEESDLVVDLGAFALREACRLLATYSDRWRLAVNVSARQFRRAGFAGEVKALLEGYGAAPWRLTLELTESVLANVEEAREVMARLADLGVRFSIDDFGTGYSSLSYLKHLPIAELKVDRSFIRDIPGDPDDRALVETMVSMARHLGLEVVAEGIESAEQSRYLDGLGRVIRQGYHLGRPAPAEHWLEQRAQASRVP